MIRNGVHRMTHTLERVLLLGQAEAHMLEWQPKEIDVVALCHSLVAETKALHPASRCEVFVDCQSGLGLAIVKQAVGLHRGSVHVRSTVGQGTIFTVRLAT